MFTPPIRTQTVYVPAPLRLETSEVVDVLAVHLAVELTREHG
jgi:hypothetical protein